MMNVTAGEIESQDQQHAKQVQKQGESTWIMERLLSTLQMMQKCVFHGRRTRCTLLICQQMVAE
jgi:hypothetical protein